MRHQSPHILRVELPLPSKATLRDRFEGHGETFERLLFELQRQTKSALRQCGIRANIKARVKSFESFYQKLQRISRSREKSASFVEIHDLVALRIVCPFLEDVALAERCIRSQFTVCEVEHKGADFSVQEFGYRSIHCLVEVAPDLLETFHLSPPFDFEIQIRTILQDAWAEVEHELVYKAEFTPFGENIRRKLAALNANLSLSDITFQEIRDHQRSLQDELGERRSRFWSMVGRATGDSAYLKVAGRLENGDSATLGVSAELDRGPERERRIGPESAWSDASGGLDRLLLEALRAHNAGGFERAEELYTQILRSQPRVYIRAIVLLHRGIARLAAERYHDALTDMNEALELDPDNWRGYFYRGTAHRMMDQYEQAERDFSTCLEHDPYQVECLFQRARLYAQLEQFDRAKLDAERAMELAPENEAVQELMNEILEEQ